MQYRREIDGLRAVAVLPVVMFHAGMPGFSGGFLGVDVFFVISGYLITGLIAAEMEKGSFSIVNFYERRARRILPALFLVATVTVALAPVVLLPDGVRDLGISVVAVAVFLSNVLFWTQSGYFGSASEETPLLHTWSLAVEEQFYVLFPLFLLLVFPFGRTRLLLFIAGIAFASLGLAEWGWRNAGTANFFLASSRAFEL
ncbi:MAG TPA: acyltransferase, partial [Hyphomonadaceae bacterium]